MTRKMVFRTQVIVLVLGFAIAVVGCSTLGNLFSGPKLEVETEKSREIFAYAEKVFNETKNLTYESLQSKLIQKFGAKSSDRSPLISRTSLNLAIGEKSFVIYMTMVTDKNDRPTKQIETLEKCREKQDIKTK